MTRSEKNVLPAEEQERRLNFWLNDQLNNLPEARLPTDYPRSSSLSLQQRVESEVSRGLREETCVAILKMSMMKDVKPFSILLASFACLLRKFTYEEDLVIGSSSRSFNPLVFRLDVGGEAAKGGEGEGKRVKSLGELVMQTQEAEKRAEENEIDFDNLIAGLRRERGLDNDALASLFQVRFFNTFDVMVSTIEAAKCDWNVFIEMESDCKRLLPLRVKIIYNAVLFSRDRMEEILLQLDDVAFQIASRSELTYHDLDIRTERSKGFLPDPRALLSNQFNGSAFLHFHQQALKNPDAPCVVETDKTYTYKEIDEASSKVARFLMKEGIEKEDIVALYAHRSSAMVVAVMGILKAGATLTVVDPAYPPARQNIYLSVAKPRGIITLKAAVEPPQDVEDYIAKELDLKCRLDKLTTNADIDALSPFPSDYPNVEVNGDNIATLSFTSGSTGIPKGVRGRHISLTHFYPWMSEEFGITSEDRFTMLSGIAHDPIQRDIFTPLFFGASLHVPLPADIGTPGRLSEWMGEAGCTITHLTPAMGQLLTANAYAGMPNLRLAFFVGDVLTKVDVMRLRALAQNVNVINMYGTTETQRSVSYYRIRPTESMREMKDILPAGVGMKGCQLVVLSQSGKECGIGELGEIFVHSYHLAKGYLGLPEPTAEKFIQNPFSEDPQNRFYRTGDLGRYLPNGQVECIGRADDQVKIRGFRIELREIDTYLGQHSQIRECVTIVRRDANEEKILVSYFVAREAGGVDLADVRSFLKTKLANYSIPSIFFQLTKMPLTPNGKIDKRKLPAPDLVDSSSSAMAAGSTPETMTKMEKRMKNLWEKLLARKIGLEDNFFDCGGHSILATRLTFQMRKEVGVDVPLNLLYTHPTIRLISPILEQSLVEPWILGDAPAPSPSLGATSSSSSSSSVACPPSPLVLAEGEKNVYFPGIQQEIVLCNEIQANGRKWAENNGGEAVKGLFLTGATGFVGCFLVRELLLSRPNALIFALIRGSDAVSAKNRLRKAMGSYQILDQVEESFEKRLVAIVGDLAKPKLGMTQEDWDKVGTSVQEIYHNGAIVHWVWPYSKLKATNVTATEEVFRLASHPSAPTLAPVFYVSSTSVFDSDYYAKLTVGVGEDDPLEAGERLATGYAQTKFVGEGLCREAQKRGLPTIIFRPAFIIGDSKSGVCNVDDYLVRMVQGCVQLGVAPEILNLVTCCAVDFVTASIVHIASRIEKYNGRAFHFCNPDRFRLMSMFQVLKEFGYEMEIGDYMQWRDQLMHYALDSDQSALFPLLHFVLDDLPNKSKNPEFDDSNMQEALKYTTIKCPPSTAVFQTQTKFLVRNKLLPPPNENGELQPEEGATFELQKRSSAV